MYTKIANKRQRVGPLLAGPTCISGPKPRGFFGNVWSTAAPG